MKTYCYIKNNELSFTSDKLVNKYDPETDTGMIYDEVIETNIEGRVCYEQGKIIAWEDSKEKAEEDARIGEQIAKAEAEYKEKRPKEIIDAIADLAKQAEGLALIGEPTEEIEAKIQELKNEYLTFKK
jgi:hypothetical protein